MNFKSIISQIAALQILAVLAASIAMPTALYLLLRNSVSNLQEGALRELDRYAEPGSTITVVTTYGEPRIPALTNLAVEVVADTTTDREVLDAHVVPGLDQVIVLC